jgi:hypothetical protein
MRRRDFIRVVGSTRPTWRFREGLKEAGDVENQNVATRSRRRLHGIARIPGCA